MTDNATQSPPSSPDEIAQRIERGREAAGLNPAPRKSAAVKEAGDGMRVAIEFVVSTIVGAVIGYALGDAAGAKAIGLVIGLIIGFLAGLRAIHRTMMTGAGKDRE